MTVCMSLKECPLLGSSLGAQMPIEGLYCGRRGTHPALHCPVYPQPSSQPPQTHTHTPCPARLPIFLCLNVYTDSSHERITCLYDLVHYHIKFYAQLHHNPKYLFKLTSVNLPRSTATQTNARPS